MARRENRWPPFTVLALLVAFTAAAAEPKPSEQSVRGARPLLKAEALGPIVPPDATSKRFITELVAYLLKHGDNDHIGKNLAAVLGMSRPAPIKSRVIEEKGEANKDGRTALMVGLAYEPFPDYPKVHENRPLAIYLLSSKIYGQDTQSLYFRVNLDGQLERVVASFGSNDENGLPTRGSATDFYPDISSKDTRASYDTAMDQVRTWLAKSPPTNDATEGSKQAAVNEMKEGTQVIICNRLELARLDLGRLRTIRGKILAAKEKVRKKQLKDTGSVGQLKAQIIEIVSKDESSSIYAAAAGIMIEDGDLAVASNFARNAVMKWAVELPSKWTDWQVEDLRWSRRDGSNAYAVKAEALSMQAAIDGTSPMAPMAEEAASLALDEALRLDPRNPQALAARATIENRARDNFYKRHRRGEMQRTPNQVGLVDDLPAPAARKIGSSRISRLRSILSFLLFLLLAGIIYGRFFHRNGPETRETMRRQRLAEINEVTQSWPPERCPPSPRDIQNALTLLEKSSIGAPVVKFLHENGVTVEPMLSDAAAGFYIPQNKEIRISQRSGFLPIHFACAIAHEGLHAMQELAWGMEPCIEKEHQAYFFHLAVYHELSCAGIETTEDLSMHQTYQRFCKQALRMDFSEFTESVLSGCVGAYQADMAERDAAAGTLLQRLRLRHDARQVQRCMESIAQQFQDPKHLFRRFALSRTARVHAEREEWQRDWIARHRDELSRGANS